MIDKNNLLRSRLEDYVGDSYCGDYLKFTDFLDEFECSVCLSYFKSIRFENYKLDGGFKEASRKMLAIFSEDNEPKSFPFETLKLNLSNTEYLGHRNILGALMNLNLARNSIGDICIIDGRAYVFCTSTAAAVIKNELEFIGKSRVDVDISESLTNYSPEKTEEKYIISSERLDCIVAAVGKFSRNKAEELISSSLVFVNGMAEKNSSKRIKENSVISVRGIGKFEVTDMSERTNRDRVKLKINKFI